MHGQHQHCESQCNYYHWRHWYSAPAYSLALLAANGRRAAAAVLSSIESARTRVAARPRVGGGPALSGPRPARPLAVNTLPKRAAMRLLQ